ncbi:hypothetical protein Csa_012521 [Cucumis sativus]|uniref:Uncharacterized protein n=1 Tax=Cucumis sativus TaxID=3659 RepID=A0A0A0KYG7_CUCSA|nr:hypothetical protein Csa_012521 [Cucumis sativus]
MYTKPVSSTTISTSFCYKNSPPPPSSAIDATTRTRLPPSASLDSSLREEIRLELARATFPFLMARYSNMFLLFLWTLSLLVLPLLLPPLPPPPMVFLFVPLVIMMLLIFFALSTSQVPTTTVAS